MQAVVGGAPHVFHSWLAGSRGLAEESGSGQHTDHCDVTDSLPCICPSIIPLLSILSHVFMSYHSPCHCETLGVMYLSLSLTLRRVLIHSFPCFPFTLLSVLHPFLPFSSLPHVSVLLARQRSALLSLTEGSCMADGRGCSFSLSLSSFLSVSFVLLSLPAPLSWRSFSAEPFSHTSTFTLHHSSVCSTFSLSRLVVTPGCCALSLHGLQLSLSLSLSLRSCL